NEDLILETYIYNLTASALRFIEQHLQETGFLHVSLMLGGTKLDPTLTSASMERWRPETHTLHLLCNECTITIDDVALQLSLPCMRSNNKVSYVGIEDELGDIRLLLDQRSEAEFEWMPYADRGIQECISVEFLANSQYLAR
ncbi:hypothetical protein Goari_002898, partial [Gossypium aridum]|nr:hypothetical protein [Gossypium aridum]